MVELALVVGVLIAIALIIVDFGKAFNFWNNENHVANLAARYAAVGSLPTAGTCAQGTTKTFGTYSVTVTSLTTYIDCELAIDATELVQGGGSKGIHTSTDTAGGATVCISVPSNAVGQPVTVTVTSKYDWLPLPIGSFAHTPLAGSATMRLESTYPWSDSQAGSC